MLSFFRKFSTLTRSGFCTNFTIIINFQLHCLQVSQSYFCLAEWILFHCNGGRCSFVRVMGCRADIKPLLLCPGGAAGVSVHQIFSLICFFLHLSVGPALICAVDGGKGPQTEREWSRRCIEGWEQKICHRHSPLVSCCNSLNSSSVGYRLLSPIHSFAPFCSSTGHYQIQIQLFSFPFIVKTWA